MKYTSFYTIRELDYKKIESMLSNESISEELKNDLKTLIEDHKAIIAFRNQLIEEQEAHIREILRQSLENSSTENKTSTQTKENDEQQSDNNEGGNPSTQETNERQSDNNFTNNEENNSSENTKEENSSSPEEKPNPPETKKTRKNGGKKKLPPGNTINHFLSQEEKICPCCGDKMHRQRSKTSTYVLALPMLSTETHISESVRCLTCDTQATAVRDDNIAEECIGRYHFSAVSSIAALRYQYGMASYRMENMSDAIGIKVADSTQWYLFENAASFIQPFICFLEKQVANAPTQHTDDTHNMVLSLVKGIEAEQEEALLQGKNPKDVRSGIHTTNITGVFPQGEIVLYKTGIHHAGEILAQILSYRTIDEQIIIMADASNAITSKIDFEKNNHVKMANCNSHAARKFIESAESEAEVAKENRIKDHKTSEYLDYFLSRYKTIFENDKKTRKMSPQERLEFHIKNSLPLMQQMKTRVDKAILNKEFEPNSKIGKDYKYFSNHFQELCAFCYFEGAPICNNLSERMLKSIIRHRKNSLFFKTLLGATVADILTSILFTAKANNLNSIEYLKNLLLYQTSWTEKPEEWLPWNYTATINKLKNKPPSD